MLMHGKFPLHTTTLVNFETGTNRAARRSDEAGLRPSRDARRSPGIRHYMGRTEFSPTR